MLPIAVFVLLVILAYIGVLLIRRLALRHRIIDHPKERSSHSFPMPRGGGLAIVVLVLVTSLWFAYETVLNRSLVYILLGAILAWVGWRDDIYSLSPKFRFLVQGLIALISIIVMGYFRVVRIPVFGDVDLGVIGILITFFWIIGMINAYNFMDGIDGMAGGVALSAGLCWLVLSSNVHNQFVFWVALSIAASSLGYLGHNWPPARIFMGDVASTFLGYSFAVLPLLSADQSGDALTIGTLLMWTVIIDPGATFIGRLLKRENIFSRHRSHLFQRLVISGYQQGTVSFLYILLTLLAGYLTYIWSHGNQIASVFIFVGLPLIWILLSVHTARLRSARTLPDEQIGSSVEGK
ncbi:MAG TPA: glycosyltransferase family 4 protein [Anaerolineales bacterium]|nr:glycosyltransferase family 4 protein [Anaerolineales bacterium]